MIIDQKIDELKDLVKTNLEDRDAIYYSLGELLLSDFAHKTDELEPIMEEHRTVTDEHFSRIALLKEQEVNIVDSETELRSLKEEEDSLREQKTSTQESMQALQDSLGEELYHLLNSQSPEVPWKRAYESLTEHIEKIRSNESELFQLESQVREKKIFNNMVLKSRLSLLKSKKKSLENTKSKLYKKCFLTAIELGAGKNEESSEFDLLAPYHRVVSEWTTIIDEELRIDEQKKLNKDRLKELCGSKGARRKRETIEKELINQQSLLEDALRKWGAAAVGNRPESFSDNQKFTDAIAKLDQLTDAAVALNAEIEKHEALREVVKFEQDLKFMETKITSLEDEIQVRKEEIKVLKKEMTDANKEIEKKKAFAGDIISILDETDSSEEDSSSDL